MANVISKGSLFPEELIPELIQKTTGASALAKLCAAKPIPFNGTKEFTFTLDKGVDIVAENGAKSNGGATLATRTVVPIKVEYGVRVSDEFLYGAESDRLDVLSAFTDGFALKVAEGIDLMAMHGINPRTNAASTVIGNNCFDKQVTQAVTIASGDKPDDNIESAIALVQGSDRDVNGMVLAPAFRSNLAKQTTADGVKLYPQLAWGNAPGEINGLRVESTKNLSANASTDRALLGDFTNNFRWGFAKEIPLEVIQYGNPDNDTDAGDLKGHNQVYLRCEAYIGWGILDAAAFATVKEG